MIKTSILGSSFPIKIEVVHACMFYCTTLSSTIHTKHGLKQVKVQDSISSIDLIIKYDKGVTDKY